MTEAKKFGARRQILENLDLNSTESTIIFEQLTVTKKKFSAMISIMTAIPYLLQRRI